MTQDSLADLDARHFDYAGAPGAALLVNVIQDTDSDDAVVQALLDRHVSLDGAAPWDTPDTVKLPLDAALENGRADVAAQLIKAGVLLKDGKPRPGSYRQRLSHRHPERRRRQRENPGRPAPGP
ncbi:MAG: hypothetical protein WDN06_15755 [Asticcacaulis sp.]